MATIGQIRGMLLEEILLYLLRASGYSTVEKINPKDDSIKQGKAGLELLGRGGVHQIDAIAEFVVSPPFSNPQRLLVEAKFFNKKSVGIEVVRNAIGVLKDVGEYWVSRNGAPARARYHYQYALFSATSYSEPAQRYAYAHDVYLIPLGNSRFMRPILDKIGSLTAKSFGAESDTKILVNLSNFRAFFRKKINSSFDNFENIGLSVIFQDENIYHQGFQDFDYHEEEIDNIDPMVYHIDPMMKQGKGVPNYVLRDLQQNLDAVREYIDQGVNKALVGMISRQFPVFLVPNERTDLQELSTKYLHHIRIYWDNEKGWWFTSTPRNNIKFSFSFDLPKKLFELYEKQGLLTNTRALDMKVDYMNEIEAIVFIDQKPRIIRFLLDIEWIEQLRHFLRNE